MTKLFQSRELYDFGGFHLDTGERALTKGGQVVPLTPKAFETLLVLVRNSGHVVEKDALLKEVWPDTFVEEGVLAVNVAAIRKALSDGEEGRSYIETVPRRGYRFIADVQQAGRASEGRVPATKPTQRKRSSPIRHGALFVGLLVLVLVGIGWFISRSRPTLAPRSFQPVPLTSYPGVEMSPTFSPDGTQVAFAWNGERQDNFDIYVKLVDRTDAVRLTSDPARDTSPAWSPDGHHIAFVRDGTIFLISPLGGAERKVADVQAWLINWTRDSKSLVVNVGKFGERRLILLSVDTGDVKALTFLPLGKEDHCPAISPDGLMLAFSRQSAPVDADLYLMPLTGGEPRLLTHNTGIIWGVTWTPDGRELVYAATAATGGARVLWRRSVEMPADSPSERIEGVESGAFHPTISYPAPKSPVRLAHARWVVDKNIWVRESAASSSLARKLSASTRVDTDPQFSLDGRRIVFRSERSGTSQIWVANGDGSNPLQLTSFSGGFTNAPRWAPDGNRIVFSSAQNSNRDIYSVSPDGSSFRRLTSEPSSEGRPSWSRDGRWIYFYSTRSGRQEIWKMPAEGGDAIRLTTDGGHESFESPDGKLLYYEDNGVKGLRSIPVENYSGPTEGSLVLDLVRPGYWAVTQKGIYFVEFDDKHARSHSLVGVFSGTRGGSLSQQIKLYDFRTHKVTQIGTIEKEVPRADCGFSVSWDGCFIAWSQVDQEESDLMMIENFR